MTTRELTKEEEAKMVEVKDEYMNRFYNWVEPTGAALTELNKKRVEFIKWVYKISNVTEPIVAIVDSPMQAEYLLNVLDRALDPKALKKENAKENNTPLLPELVEMQKYFKEHTLPMAFDLFPEGLKEKGESLESLWADFEHAQKTGQFKYYAFSSYVNCRDIPWIGYYDFFERIGVDLESPVFTKYKEFAHLGIYDTIQLDQICVIIKQPLYIKRRVDKLHAENGPALSFPDQYNLYFWLGTAVPKKLIETPENVTKNDIMEATNAELRRCFMDKLGGKTYYSLLGDGKPLKLLDEDVDSRRKIRKLYEIPKDPLSGDKVVFVEVKCPSTNRKYTLYPDPKYKVKTCQEAVNATFKNEPGKYRQGDVMIVIKGKETSVPEFET